MPKEFRVRDWWTMIRRYVVGEKVFIKITNDGPRIATICQVYDNEHLHGYSVIGKGWGASRFCFEHELEPYDVIGDLV